VASFAERCRTHLATTPKPHCRFLPAFARFDRALPVRLPAPAQDAGKVEEVPLTGPSAAEVLDAQVKMFPPLKKESGMSLEWARHGVRLPSRGTSRSRKESE
jgi:hypothetical protein